MANLLVIKQILLLGKGGNAAFSVGRAQEESF